MADSSVGGVAEAPPGSVGLVAEARPVGQGNRVAEAPQPEPQTAAPHPEPESAEEMDWQKEALSLRKENKRWRDRTHEAETRYENAKKVFPNLDEMTPEMLVSVLETERAERQKIETEVRELRMDQALRAVTAAQGVDHDLTYAYLVQSGGLKDVDMGDPDVGRVLTDMVADIKGSKPQLAVQEPGVPAVSGTGRTPGVSDQTSSTSQMLSEGKWDDYLNRRRESEGAYAGNGSVTLVDL